jgi:enamine deaminase RidA (YjgF/YER057c/UK114 family)
MIEPAGLPPAVGFSHVVVPQAGNTIYVAGQIGQRPDGSMSQGLVEQFAQACRNLQLALGAAGSIPEHVVSLTIYATDLPAYRAALRPLGEAYRKVFGSHYPAMALIGVDALFEPAALVELVATAVVPAGPGA